MTKIKARKDLFNSGKCFTKDKEYQVNFDIDKTASLMDIEVINDEGKPHIIGGWWRDFEIVHECECNSCDWKGKISELVYHPEDEGWDGCPDCDSEDIYYLT